MQKVNGVVQYRLMLSDGTEGWAKVYAGKITNGAFNDPAMPWMRGVDDVNEREAYLAMALFIWEYDARTGGKASIFDMKTDLVLDIHGNSLDPAARSDWVDCVEKIRSGDVPAEIAQRA